MLDCSIAYGGLLYYEYHNNVLFGVHMQYNIYMNDHHDQMGDFAYNELFFFYFTLKVFYLLILQQLKIHRTFINFTILGTPLLKIYWLRR